MTTQDRPTSTGKMADAGKILMAAATTWFVVATAGQWLFGAYIVLFYGKSTVTGDFARWNNVLPHGYVAGDGWGNLIVGTHVMLAAVLVIGGPLQFVPAIRNRFRRFHRWLGRAYVATALVVSLAGVTMVWTRGSVGDTSMHVSISLQAVYIVAFALLSIHHARARRFAQHRIWTLRLFMVTNGVWFFRVGLMAWLLLNNGPAGFDPDTFTGPFLTCLAVFTYAIPIPLLVLELYVYALRRRSGVVSLLTAALIVLLTLLMAVGIFGATVGMWLPRL